MPKSFDSAADIPDLSGKVIVVTGGNAGLGAETVRRLAVKSPKKIFLCARTPSTAQALIGAINAPSGTIQAISLDLSSLESVSSAAASITASTDRLDLLFLNAGVSGTVPGLTKEGYEWQFGINHVGHTFFTQLLLPLLLKTTGTPNSDVRIITTASEAQANAPGAGLVLDDCKTDMSSYNGMARYAQSKLANILFAKKLAQLYPSISSISLHPGVVKTDIINKAVDVSLLFRLIAPLYVYIVGVTVEEGGKTQLWAATSQDAESGKYYLPIGKESNGVKYGNDQKKIDELWDWTTKELATHGANGWPEA